MPVPLPSEPQQAPIPTPLRNKIIGSAIILTFIGLVALLDAPLWQIIRGQAPLFIVLWLLLKLLLAVFWTIVVHELGHLSAGWCMGFHFIAVRFGPIEITRPFRIGLSRTQLLPTSGLTKMVPTSAHAYRIRMFVYLMGGCAANLLSAYVALRWGSSSSPFVAWFAVISIMVGIGNLMPFRRSGYASDGKRILKLSRPNASERRIFALIKINAQMKNGITAAEIRPDLLSDAIGVIDNSFATVVTHVWAYNAKWDTAPEAETARLLEIALQYSNCASPSFRESLFCDAGAFQATKRKNVELARQWLAEIPESTPSPWLRPWIESAIKDAEGNVQGAIQKLDEVERLLQVRYPEKPISKSLQKWRAELLAKQHAFQAVDATQ
jgi:hypothetical protein